jgi:redox-sensitive bicupin YhaK (pirin superfamily)
MTAGSGILHIETPPEWLVQSGGLFHGIQLWVNLPRDEKLVAPKYQDIRSHEVALLTSYDAGALVRVIAGQVGPQAGPGSTHTPMALVHATIEPGARLDLPWNQDYNALVYVLNGHGKVGTDALPIHTGQSAVLGAGDFVTIAADGSQESRSPQLDVIVVGGKPIGQSIAWAGPFVMNTKSEVLQAYEDFQKGNFGHIPG